MFKDTIAFNQPIGSWNVSNIKDMSSMFEGAIAFNQPIGSWNVSNVEQMRSMFKGANVFNQSLENWVISNARYTYDLFTDTALSTNNYDSMLIKWSTLNLNRCCFRLDAGNTQYSFKAKAAREKLIKEHNWKIIDGGMMTPIQ